MMWKWIGAAFIVLAGCSRSETNQQGAADKQTVQPVNTATVDAGSGAPEAAPQLNEVSGGMPVPGTKTPEHVVENEQTVANNISGL